METSLSTHYYIKALDAYPYDLTEFMEAIHYALSYDENNSDAHSLLGHFYLEQMNRFDDARYHFEQALTNNINLHSAYYGLIRLYLLTDELEEAQTLINFARKSKGICQSTLLHREVIIMEKRNQFKAALKHLDKALKHSVFSSDIDFLKRERNRIKDKLPKRKKKKKKKKKKKS